ncbi:sensor histidine kinase [Ramlibacter algicola]|uniref:Histidine kinase n=1 Tax=Ramlibacter algicola TaxID=2795217 RepID=A0A934UR29_9BURK|nr:histidine kinase [Ramlibacter algicola]MBK0392755.1 histidine kinase [Ramlibacter algicola]
MSSVPLDTDRPTKPGWRATFPSWRSLAITALVAAWMAALLLPFTLNSYVELLGEFLFIGIVILFSYTGAARCRVGRVPPWAVQLLAVVVAALMAPLLLQVMNAGGSFAAFAASRPHVRGYWLVTFAAAIIGVFVALGALVREREALAKAQALKADLLQERLERQEADARLGLMTAQIQPHFLLNTLANVQELVETGSPRAAPVFRSLIAYLRAAMPRLEQRNATLGDEHRLVTAYLDLMQMRMPDRLEWNALLDPTLRDLPFPPMALLTLVENAIRHGIDPSVRGGRVEVLCTTERDGTVQLEVIDDGAGLSEKAGEGTGLANLRQRLAVFYGPRARLELAEHEPQGVRARIRIAPAAQA